MALRRLYGFSTKRLLTVMQTANEFVEMANEGKMSVLSMMQEIEENTDIKFDEMNKNLVKKMGVQDGFRQWMNDGNLDGQMELSDFIEI